MLDFSSQHLGYSRALTFSSGKLYVIGSSTGKVAEITDFDHAVYKVYQSAGKKEPIRQETGSKADWCLMMSNSLRITGMRVHTSVPPFSLPGQNYNNNTNKLIRFKTWGQFQTGNWEDLTPLLPDGLVPYYLTASGEYLYIPLFNQQTPGQGDCIFRLTVQ